MPSLSLYSPQLLPILITEISTMSKPTTPTSWPEHPFTLIRTVNPSHASSPYDEQTIHIDRLMALTHNTVFRALNAIHTQAPLISTLSDTKDLLTFTKFTLDFLSNHHRCEEVVFFPMLEAQAKKPGMMRVDVVRIQHF